MELFSSATAEEVANDVELYASVTALMTNQLKGLVRRSSDRFRQMFDTAKPLTLPVFAVDMVLDEERNAMTFSPGADAFCIQLAGCLETMSSSMQGVIPIDKWLSGAAGRLAVAPDADYSNRTLAELREFIQERFEPVMATLQEFEKYQCVLDGGEAAEEVNTFITEEHSFAECKEVSSMSSLVWLLTPSQMVAKYQKLAEEINAIQCLFLFPMVDLRATKLRDALFEKANMLVNKLLTKMTSDHKAFNQRYVCLLERLWLITVDSESALLLLSSPRRRLQSLRIRRRCLI